VPRAPPSCEPDRNRSKIRSSSAGRIPAPPSQRSYERSRARIHYAALQEIKVGNKRLWQIGALRYPAAYAAAVVTYLGLGVAFWLQLIGSRR